MKTHCKIELPNLQEIVKILNKKVVVDTSKEWLFDKSQKEVLMDVPELWEDLKIFGAVKDKLSYAAIVMAKSVFGPHRDHLDKQVALNIPLRNCENTHLVFYETLENVKSVKNNLPSDPDGTYFEYKHSQLKEIGRINYVNTAIAFRVDAIHDVIGALDEHPRITVSMRFKDKITFGL